MCEGRKGLGEKSHEWRLSSDLQTLLIALWKRQFRTTNSLRGTVGFAQGKAYI